MNVDRKAAILLAGVLTACSAGEGAVRVVTATSGPDTPTQLPTSTESLPTSAPTEGLIATAEATEAVYPAATVKGEFENQNVFDDPRENADMSVTIEVGTVVSLLGQLADQGEREWVCVMGGPAIGTMGEDLGKEFEKVFGWMARSQLEVPPGFDWNSLPQIEICAAD